MTARLISYQQGYELDPDMASAKPQRLISYCARVSNPSNQMNVLTDEKLLAYLSKHKHWSPFEMVSVCIEIETTRDIARQILRHRSFSFQEFSQRYGEIGTLHMEPVYSRPRFQDPKNRQNSIELPSEDEVSSERLSAITSFWHHHQKEVWFKAITAYNWAIEAGIAKEVARKVLPEGLTPSRLYVNGTLRSWIHYLDVRLDESTQLEHREVAYAVAKAISLIYNIE